MSSGRAVRIPRSGPPSPGAPAPGPVLRKVNGAGTQRAFRLSILYVVVLGVLYAVLASLEETGPGAGSSGAATDLIVITVLAIGLAVGGVVFALSQAPRAVEFEPNATVVVGRWGRRRPFPALASLAVREVRQYPAGLLSSAPVVAVELRGERGRPTTMMLEKGILEPPTGSRPP